MRRAKRIGDRAFTVAFTVHLVLVASFLVIPLVMTAIMSFDDRAFLGRFPPPALSLRWYRAFLGDSYFMTGLWNSIRLGLVAAVVATAMGVAAAIVLDRYAVPGKAAIAAFLLSPFAVPTVILGFAVLVFSAMVGVTNGFMRLVAGHVVLVMPYAFRTTLASLVGIKRSLTEAALILGATERQAFLDVTFPLAKTGIVAGLVLGFALSVEEVSLSLFLFDPASYTLPVAILSTMRAQFNLTLAAAAMTIMVFTVLVVLVLERLFGLDKVMGSGLYKT
jgi:putative spermidine/putrescine transport system permease protein